MANISFEESQAKAWQAEVEAELKLIATINEDAGRCLQDLAEEGRRSPTSYREYLPSFLLLLVFISGRPRLRTRSSSTLSGVKRS